MEELDTAKTFSQTGNEKTVQDVISKLRFISKIKPGEKINVKSLFVRDNNIVWQRVIRTIRNLSAEDGENKQSTLIFLETVVDESINLICIYKKDMENAFNLRIANLIISNLESSIVGMEALIKTYEIDRNYTSKIEALMETLSVRLESLRRNGVIDE